MSGGFRVRGFGLRRRKLGPREPSQDCLSQVVGWETVHGPKPDTCSIAVWGEGVWGLGHKAQDHATILGSGGILS